MTERAELSVANRRLLKARLVAAFTVGSSVCLFLSNLSATPSFAYPEVRITPTQSLGGVIETPIPTPTIVSRVAPNGPKEAYPIPVVDIPKPVDQAAPTPTQTATPTLTDSSPSTKPATPTLTSPIPEKRATAIPAVSPVPTRPVEASVSNKTSAIIDLGLPIVFIRGETLGSSPTQTPVRFVEIDGVNIIEDLQNQFAQ